MAHIAHLHKYCLHNAWLRSTLSTSTWAAALVLVTMQVLSMSPCDTYGESQLCKNQHFERCLQGECGGFRRDLEALRFDVRFYKLTEGRHPNRLPHPIGTTPQELYAAAGDALHVCFTAVTALTHSIFCGEHQSVLQHGVTSDRCNAATTVRCCPADFTMLY